MTEEKASPDLPVQPPASSQESDPAKPVRRRRGWAGACCVASALLCLLSLGVLALVRSSPEAVGQAKGRPSVLAGSRERAATRPSAPTPPPVLQSLKAAPTPSLVSQDLTNFDLKDSSIDPSELTTDSLTVTGAPHIEGNPNGADTIGDNMPAVNEGGGTPAGTSPTMIGMGGYDVKGVGLGPVYHSTGGGRGNGNGEPVLAGGTGSGFGSRGMRRGMLASGGGTKRSETSVASALAWLARHQNPDGSWSMDHTARCTQAHVCSGPGTANAPGAATALGLMPFLAAGQTHETRGPYRDNIQRATGWLVSHQKPSGDLSVTGGETQMYSHGLAATALCEAYGMSHDRALEAPAQAALHFIVAGQDRKTGGWPYQQGQPGGDTLIVGWQLMALKSGSMAGLLGTADHGCFDGASQWLAAVAKGESKGLFAATPSQEPSDTMTAVGVLCTQFLGAHYSDPRIVEGARFLTAHLPSAGNDPYYWYFGTQAMHQQPGPDWDKWNRQQRTVLITSQCKDSGCVNGSWEPVRGMGPWAARGGRLTMTSLGALAMEVYYRYLPLYKLQASTNLPGGLHGAEAALPEPAVARPAEKKPAPVRSWKPAKAVPNASRLMIGDNEELPLEGMQADVRIDGFRARVVLDCFYYNDQPRQLEGTFQLRLPNEASPFFFAFGQTVYRAAVGKPNQPVFFPPEQVGSVGLQPDDIVAFRRQSWEQPKVARVVQKEKAAYAYRETVRRRIDPALMEWSGAGVFNGRVFPLAANRLHRVVIGYDLDLVRTGEDLELRLNLPDIEVPCVVDVSLPVDAAERVTLGVPAAKSSDGGRVSYRLSDPCRGPVAVRVHEPAPVMLAGSDGKTGEYFAARFRPDLPAETDSVGPDSAVFLVDASLSSRPEQFNVWLELLRAVLENNRDGLKRFAVLFFNVEAFWWQERFVENTPQNVEALMKYAQGLSVEGATDLGQALTEAVAPRWLPAGGKHVSPAVLFLLSDGAATWGQCDWSALSSIVAASGAGPLFAYNTGFSGSEGRLLAQLAARSGGAVFSVVGQGEIAKAARAHRSPPWRIAGVNVQGGSDLLLAGRPQFLFPGQELLLVGRGTPPRNPQVVLTLARGTTTRTVTAKIGRVLPSQLAARTYGQVAVGQLEELALAAEPCAAAYARHFRVLGQTCSLLMLDTEQDYARFHIQPEEDALVVASVTISQTLAKVAESSNKLLADAKTACLAWLEKLQRTEGVPLQLPEALRLAVGQMPESSFVVTVRPLTCKARTREALPADVQQMLASPRVDYDLIAAEAERRLERYGPDDALRAASSLVEDRPGDPVAIRDVAFSAMSWGLYGQAYHLLRRCALARPYEPQTYLQLAECLETLGQADLALVYYELAYSGAWDNRFGDFHTIAAMDYFRFLHRAADGKKGTIPAARKWELSPTCLDFARARLVTLSAECKPIRADLLVTIAWNTDGTDVDLHVTEPGGEECFYEHTQTASGGRISRDVTTGLGPERYILPHAPAGAYHIRTHYFAGDANRASARTKVYATIYQNWATPEERLSRKAVSLPNTRDVQDLATLIVGAPADGLPIKSGLGSPDAVDPYLDRP